MKKIADSFLELVHDLCEGTWVLGAVVLIVAIVIELFKMIQ